MHFECTSEQRGDVVVVTPFGEIDRDTAPRLREVLDDAAGRAGAGRIEVDLRHVTFLDSSGIGALLYGHRLAERSGATFIAHGASPMVRTVMEITNVWTLLTDQS